MKYLDIEGDYTVVYRECLGEPKLLTADSVKPPNIFTGKASVKEETVMRVKTWVERISSHH